MTCLFCDGYRKEEHVGVTRVHLLGAHAPVATCYTAEQIAEERAYWQARGVTPVMEPGYECPAALDVWERSLDPLAL